ncbi:TetR/AcrR family transcriptional regulator [Enterococcus caccae]|uniref:HTH tetR-type domain-containing protein n=1 Tax=Enterococcus caccae ATCC BAA-1240 TaxID=1158612 RepID=R3TSZ4_9ENTE|nr:TetR/AcrR family transcriptional regulator [Enterococcus caccae]EOL44293.1 hypothetical protein UC7_02337 [Enterococcus caccae ATCC BAA-1240]EOT68591.1 hypothetical protein I580_00974 [Enterococcus caccae ATCC BAA-1240]OJG28193.1 hypothetical protein RU98_GL001441 [Enterococcus caccae]
MVRKKIYKKQHILAAAQNLLIEKSFSAITARNVAEYMGISTQPIYLEFKNMEELKLSLLKKTHEYLEREYFSQLPTTSSVANFGINYINLAKANRKLYISLYVDQHSYGNELRQLSFDSFRKNIKNEVNYVDKGEKELENLHLNLWIVAIGMASLSISGMLDTTEENLISVFERVERNYNMDVI